MNELVPIGRFSKMTRLSIKALRHYAELGLLVPAEVDESSGYRYYRLSQANLAEAIRALRSVDMPLDEIGELLGQEEPEIAHKLLTDHHRRLLDRLADQERMIAYLERLIDQEETLMPYDVTTKTVPDTHVVATKRHVSLATIGAELGPAFTAVATAAARPPAGAPFVVFHDIIDEGTDGTIEVCYPIAEPLELDGGGHDADQGTGAVYGATLAATTVAATTHQGPYEEVSPAYHSIVGWVTEHGHEFAGPAREIYLNDPTTTEPSEYLTEVQWPIT